MRILVIGKSGQLARQLGLLGGPHLDIILCGRETLDLAAPTELASAIKASRPDAVINAGAYTKVDAAETDEVAAFALNCAGPEAAALACADLSIPFINVSTDYVFDGQKSGAYTPADAPRPTSAYGRSKHAGEERTRAAHPGSTIIRTSWVYSAQGANFPLTMLRLAQTRDEIGVVADQYGTPTWAADLAQACLIAATTPNPGGIYHYSGAGRASWADFAEAIFREARARGLKGADVKRITTADYPTPAKRPANSCLDASAFEHRFGFSARPWTEALSLCFDEIAPRA
jgi:dTDP-4-dehydrorhamnose reductase